MMNIRMVMYASKGAGAFNSVPDDGEGARKNRIDSAFERALKEFMLKRMAERVKAVLNSVPDVRGLNIEKV